MTENERQATEDLVESCQGGREEFLESRMFRLWTDRKSQSRTQPANPDLPRKGC